MDHKFLQKAVLEAFQNHYVNRRKTNLVLVVNEQGEALESKPANIVHTLSSFKKIKAKKPNKKYETVLCFNFLANIFNCKAGFQHLLGLVGNNGTLIYGHDFSSAYFGLTAKWLLDSFIFSNIGQLNAYLFWAKNERVEMATYDFDWIYGNCVAKYNPMWDNEIFATHAVFIASKIKSNRTFENIIPVQDIYRPQVQWEAFKKRVQILKIKNNFCHFKLPPPQKIPPGLCQVLTETKIKEENKQKETQIQNLNKIIKTFIAKVKNLLP